MTSGSGRGDSGDFEKRAAETQRERLRRSQGYRARALEMYPWVCGRCAREFDRSNVRELTVHHRDHDHDHNPPDGSNWELLCIYCHDQEHQVQLEAAHRAGAPKKPTGQGGHATQKPFEGLAELLKKKP